MPTATAKPRNRNLLTSRGAVFKMARTTLLPTRDELLGFILDPDTSQDDLHTVSTLLVGAAAVYTLPRYQAMRREATAEKQCVRCHHLFTDDSNKMGACVIPHVFDPGSGGYSSDKPRYASKCCGRDIEPKENGPGSCNYTTVHRLGMCYEGYHTEDAGEVEDDDEEGYNNINIRRCRMANGKCVREVLYADDEPEFWGNFD